MNLHQYFRKKIYTYLNYAKLQINLLQWTWKSWSFPYGVCFSWPSLYWRTHPARRLAKTKTRWLELSSVICRCMVGEEWFYKIIKTWQLPKDGVTLQHIREICVWKLCLEIIYAHKKSCKIQNCACRLLRPTVLNLWVYYCQHIDLRMSENISVWPAYDLLMASVLRISINIFEM